MSFGLTPGVLGAPEPRMYPRSGYFLVKDKPEGGQAPARLGPKQLWGTT